jgi:hypothetical protein
MDETWRPLHPLARARCPAPAPCFAMAHNPVSPICAQCNATPRAHPSSTTIPRRVARAQIGGRPSPLRARVGASLAAGASGGITRCGREWGQSLRITASDLTERWPPLFGETTRESEGPAWCPPQRLQSVPWAKCPRAHSCSLLPYRSHRGGRSVARAIRGREPQSVGVSKRRSLKVSEPQSVEAGSIYGCSAATPSPLSR